MKLTTHAKVGLVLVLTAIILSFGIFRITTYKSVSPCFNTPACQETTTGNLRVVRYGFPSVYRQTANFKPDISTSFANASVEQQGLSWLYIATNIVFWFALLNGVYKLFQKVAGNKAMNTVNTAALHSPVVAPLPPEVKK
jgi:hypothetical protein